MILIFRLVFKRNKLQMYKVHKDLINKKKMPLKNNMRNNNKKINLY